VNEGLWLLLRLRIWSWMRRLGGGMQSVKGALLGIFCFLLFCLWALPSMVLMPPATEEHLEKVRRFGPFALLFFFLLNILTSAGEKAVSFSPAEVNLLFSGPFSRRQLLAYKIVFSFGITFLSALFMVIFLHPHAGSYGAAILGLTLGLMFLQLSTMIVILIGTMIGARAYNRRRQAGLVLIGALVVLALFHVGEGLAHLSPMEILSRMEETPAFRVVLAPFHWYTQVFTARTWGIEMLKPLILGVTGNLVLLALVFGLDAPYLEAAAGASDRINSRLQRIRSGGAAAAWQAPSLKARFSIPDLPWWGGAGPVAWRQLTAITRSRGPLVVFVVFSFTLGITGFIGLKESQETTNLAPIVGSIVAWLSIFMTAMVPFDFRGDLDRMEVLKTLPIRPSRLVVGQLAAPVLLISAFQVCALLFTAGMVGHIDWFFGATMAFILPFNFLLFEIENLLFLWYPVRMAAAAVGDFQAMGRNMLLMFAKMVVLGAVGVILGVVGGISYLVVHLAGGPAWLVTGIAVWFVFVGCAAALVPLIALAFSRFDVTRDTPP
jgi:hypothetical protein